jgi:hypothetical protein
VHALIYGGSERPDTSETTHGIPQRLKTLPNYIRSYGAHKIATSLRHNDWDVEVLDFLPGWTLEQLKTYTAKRVNNKTKFFGFSLTFRPQSKEFVKQINDLIAWMREEYPSVKILAGSQSYFAITDINADYHLVGWAENAVEKCLEGNLLDFSKHKEHLILHCNDKYPAYPRENLAAEYEERDYLRPDEPLHIELARGCKFKCTFCAFPVIGVKGDYTRTAEGFRKELETNYEKWGTTKYILIDETVNDSPEKIKKFADATKGLPFQPSMVGFARGDLTVAQEKHWDDFIRLGFTNHYYGIETFNPPSMKFIRKAMGVDKLQEGLLRADEYFSERSLYKGHISLIAGLPKDVPETLDKTVDWIRKNWHSRKNSTSMFALQIKSDFFAGHDTHSELDRKASEFGYREMTPEEYDAIIPSDHQRIEGNMYWMNDADNTNWWQMHLYSNNYTNTTFHEQGFPVWSIPYWKMIHTDEEIDEMQGKPWAHFLPSDFVDSLVSEYISQKL